MSPGRLLKWGWEGPQMLRKSGEDTLHLQDPSRAEVSSTTTGISPHIVESLCPLVSVHSSKKPKPSIPKAVPQQGQAPDCGNRRWVWRDGAQAAGDGHQLVFWKSGAPSSRGGGQMPAPPPQLLRAPPPLACPSPSHLQTTLNSQTCLQSQTAGESCHVTGPGPDPPHPGRRGCPGLCLPFPGGTRAFSLRSSRGNVAQTCFEYQGLQRSKKQARYFGNTECAN